MFFVADAESRVADLVAAARRAGADAADAVYFRNQSTEVQVRLGALEDVGRSDGEEIGLRLFVGKRSASVSSSDLSPDALAALVERAAAMAREAPEDEYAGLAPVDRLLTGDAIDVDADDGEDPSPAALRARALAAEEGRARHPRGHQQRGRGGQRRPFADGARHLGRLRARHGQLGLWLLGERDRGRGRGHAARLRLSLDPPPRRPGGARRDRPPRRRGERAVARLNPGKLASGPMPVVFDPRVGTSLLGHLAGAITGAAIARRTSFLLGRLGEQVFASGLTVRDDPHRSRGLRSRAFDGEGLPTAPMDIIADGILTTWLLDSASARQLGLAPTGHAARGGSGAPGAGTSNLYLEAGTVTVAELIADIGLGVFVTELIGQGVNGITGDYSRGASGFAIRDGGSPSRSPRSPSPATSRICSSTLPPPTIWSSAARWTCRRCGSTG